MLSSLIVTEARNWLGTPYRHQGRAKQNGGYPGNCDCLGLLIGIAQSLSLRSKHPPYPLLASLDNTSYSRIPDSARLQALLSLHCIPIEKEAAQIGDILWMRIGRLPQHLGILTSIDPLAMIHAYEGIGRVAEHRLDTRWANRIAAVYRIASN